MPLFLEKGPDSGYGVAMSSRYQVFIVEILWVIVYHCLFSVWHGAKQFIDDSEPQRGVEVRETECLG